jgi:hypothetical protein
MRSDKRPYKYKQADADGSNVSVKKQIPDMTMELHACTNYELGIGFQYGAKDCKEDDDIRSSHPSVSKERIKNQMNE